MNGVIEAHDEKAELETVLSSDTFVKSPNLAKLLSYVCNKYFQGCAGDLKEYNIGVEAMGRPSNFDPTVNSVVRVEAHRLREKLKKYYENEGSQHQLVITLQVGHYVPQFIRREALPLKSGEKPNGSKTPEYNSAPIAPVIAGVQTVVSKLTGSAQPQISPQTASSLFNRYKKPLMIVAAVFLFLGAILPVWKFGLVGHKAGDSGAVREDEKSIQTGIGDDQGVRILAGYTKDKYIDSSAKVWRGDRYFKGGTAVSQTRRFISRTLDPTLYQTYRMGDFSYDVPMKPGVYELRLYFAELFFGVDSYNGGGETSRVFSVDLNGKSLLQFLDVLGDAGGANISYVGVFKDIAPAPDGYIHLNFIHVRDEPIISALEIVPGIPGRIHSIRIVAQDTSYTDHEGRLWSPDSYFSGGRLTHHKGPDTGTSDPDLYSGERYGNFSYALPVAPGKYRVTLRFAETYFGPGNPGGGGLGNRVFNVFSSGRVLLHNFDIFKEAGGANLPLDKTFSDLEPDAQGKLLLTFVPVVNYACVDAIEVVDQSR